VKNKTVLITGSTDGIGKQTALELANLGAQILVHGKDKNKEGLVVDVIISKTKNKNIHLLTSDFSSLNQVRKLAGEITSKFNRLEVLINNVGVFMKERILTEDNYETTFAVNHLAHFLLTYLLMDMIKQSSPSRIIVVTSMVYSSSIDFGNLRGKNILADMMHTPSRNLQIFCLHISWPMNLGKVVSLSTLFTWA